MSNRLALLSEVSITSAFSCLSTALDSRLFSEDDDFRLAVKPFCEKLLKDIKAHMPEKLAHANRVGKLVTQFCLHAGMSAEDALIYGEAARLHDIGYLSRERKEWRSNEKPDPALSLRRKIWHTKGGNDILGQCDSLTHRFITEARSMARLHHERLDGKGPHGLTDLPEIVKIVGAIDAFDGDKVPKPGVEPRTPQEALDRLRTCDKYQGAYDPEIVEEFGRMLGLD